MHFMLKMLPKNLALRLTVLERWKIRSLFYDKKILRKLYVTDFLEILKKFIFSSTKNI